MNVMIFTTYQPPGTRKIMKSYNFIHFVQLNKSGFLEWIFKNMITSK